MAAAVPDLPRPVWEAALCAVASAERGAVRAWEVLVPLMLAVYPTRAAAVAARAARCRLLLLARALLGAGHVRCAWQAQCTL